MDNFIFSLNATVPIFIIIFIGYFLRYKGLVNDNFVNIGNKIGYIVFLPTLLFKDISETDVKSNFDIKFILFCVLATVISIAVIWILSEIFMKDKKSIGSFVQGSFRGSAAVLGIAFVQNMYGSSGMAPMMVLGAVPLYNIFSVIILTIKSENSLNSKNLYKESFINILKNPIIWGIVIGLIFSLLEIKLPIMINKAVESVASLATPFALIILGAGFEGKKALSKIKPTLVATALKLFIIPAVFIPVAVYMGFRNQEMIAILIMLGAPSTVSCYVMAKNLDNDHVLASSIVVASTFLSSFSITMWIFILKTMGYL